MLSISSNLLYYKYKFGKKTLNFESSWVYPSVSFAFVIELHFFQIFGFRETNFTIQICWWLSSCLKLFEHANVTSKYIKFSCRDFCITKASNRSKNSFCVLKMIVISSLFTAYPRPSSYKVTLTLTIDI